MRIKKESNIIKTIGITTDLSKITLNVNSLNSSITGHRFVEWIKKEDPTIYSFVAFKKHTSLSKTNTGLKLKNKKYYKKMEPQHKQE
jgi:hypothetical protein